jgi:hypothetical protein
MGAIVPVSAINKMVIRGLNIILLMSMGVIATGVVKIKHALLTPTCIITPVRVSEVL